MSELDIHSIRLDKEGMKTIVSELEAGLMNHLWEKGPLTVREIYDEFKDKREVALTTIGVTLDRMHSKGLVEREICKGRGGLKYIYQAEVTKEELGKSIAEKVVKKLGNAFGNSFTSYFSKNKK